MARIEVKNKNNVAGKVWTWFVGILLTVVFFASVLLLVLFFINKNKDDENEEEEITFEEKYPEAELITFEDLEERILEENLTDDSLIGTNYDVIYVFVYSPDYETYPNGEKVSTNVNLVIDAIGNNEGDTKFFVINTEEEDNKNFDLASSTLLSSLASNKSPYLIKITISQVTGNLEIDEVLTVVGDINNELHGLA